MSDFESKTAPQSAIRTVSSAWHAVSPMAGEHPSSGSPDTLKAKAVAVVGKVSDATAAALTDAKRRSRRDLPRMRHWRRLRYHRRPECLEEPRRGRACAREHSSRLTVSAFVERYERRNLPVVIDGLTSHEAGWAPADAWTVPALYQRFGHSRFKCGEDDDGAYVKLRLKHFLRYMARQTDDSPLYIFDSDFRGRKRVRAVEPSSRRLTADMLQTLLGMYTVPPYFSDDLLKLVGEATRPVYRWVLLGPKRSGSGVHIDPLATSAWNALLHGRKRWLLFPPSTPREWVIAATYLKPKEDDEPIDYFTNIAPRIQAAHPDLEVLDFVQYPGETIFVPGGWWHAVLNLDDTVAVTQNFCSRTNFPHVWRACRHGRKRLAATWLRELQRGDTYADLAAVARRLNEEDGCALPAAPELAGAGFVVIEPDGAESSDSDGSCSTCEPAGGSSVSAPGASPGSAAVACDEVLEDGSQPAAEPETRPNTRSTGSDGPTDGCCVTVVDVDASALPSS